MSQNHQSDLRYTVPLECRIDGCPRDPKWNMVGHLHFTLDGVEYSMDRMVLCDHHREVVEELIAPKARESRLKRSSGERNNDAE